MDASPAEGIDAFSRVLPLPFRLELELILGFWLWGLNLHGFHLLNVDIFSLIRYPVRPTDDESIPLHISTYRLAGFLTGLWTIALVVFWQFTRGDEARVVAYDWIPNLLFLVILAVLFLPRTSFSRRLFGSQNAMGVARLWTGLRRVAFGGIAKARPDKFGDVLLADALTSYAKPLSEIFVAFCMFFKGLGTTVRPDRLCGHEIVVPLAIAWPFVIRLRQCVKEEQWLNALKYSTAFPVVVLSTMARGNDGLRVAWYVHPSQTLSMLAWL